MTLIYSYSLCSDSLWKQRQIYTGSRLHAKYKSIFISAKPLEELKNSFFVSNWLLHALKNKASEKTCLPWRMHRSNRSSSIQHRWGGLIWSEKYEPTTDPQSLTVILHWPIILSQRHAGYKWPENSNLNKCLLLPILGNQCSDTIQTDNIVR